MGMETTMTIQGRANRAARRQLRRQHAAARRTAAQPRSLRARVASAFRQTAHGVQDKSAYAATVAFFRATRHDWTRQLGR
jgi:hypothetical protein